MGFLDKKTISEGIVNFTGKKRYMLVYEDGTLWFISMINKYEISEM